MAEQMKFKMRFVGFKEDGSGELKPTSPGGFKHHEIRELAFEYSLSIWWEIVDSIPDLVLPEPRYEDSVYIEEIFVPPEETETGELGEDPSDEEEEFIELPPIEGFTSTQDVGDIITVKVDEMTVKELKDHLKERDVKVASHWRKADLIREAREFEESLRAASTEEEIESE